MRYLYFLLVMSLLMVPNAFGDPAVAAEGTDIAALIRQLGDDVPKVREQATVKLRQLGRAALGALAEAQNDSDPEVVARAQLLTRQIDEDLHPRPRPLLQDRFTASGLRLNRIGPGAAGNAVVRVQAMRVGSSRSVSMTRSPDGATVKETVVKENGEEIKIREAADGVTVRTTKTAGGKDISTVIKAKDKEALKKDEPEAYALYERHTNAAAMPARVGQLNIDGLLDAQARVEVERARADAERRLVGHERLIEAQQRLIEQRV